MKHVSDGLRGAVVGFVVLLSKGLLDDARWDWDVEKLDWQDYLAGFTDPTILRTTMAVFMNTLTIDDVGGVNSEDARFRAFQYFRTQVDPAYPLSGVTPAFGSIELVEPDPLRWES